MNIEYKKGQALLLILLAMATLATMVLSVVSRSVSEVSVTTREDESLRAFSAAEAGVEEALIHGSQQDINEATVPISLPPKDLKVPSSGGGTTISTYNANISRYPEDLKQFNYPFELKSGEAGSVWFRTRNGDNVLDCSDGACFNGNSLTLCWGKTTGGESPAIVANILYKDGSGNMAMRPIGYDSDGTRRGTNNFSAPTTSNGSCRIGDQAYQYSANINLGASTLPGRVGPPIIMRITTLYNPNTSQIFGVSTVSSNENLPVQGRKVTSEGKSGESTRKIDAYLLNADIPFIFDAALYSETGLTK